MFLLFLAKLPRQGIGLKENETYGTQGTHGKRRYFAFSLMLFFGLWALSFRLWSLDFRL